MWKRIVIRKTSIVNTWYDSLENEIFDVEDFLDEVYIVRGKKEKQNRIEMIYKCDTIDIKEFRKEKLERILC